MTCWISVDDELPSVGETVLTTRANVAGLDWCPQEYMQGDESDWHYWSEYTPTHWMRIPPVPFADSEGKR